MRTLIKGEIEDFVPFFNGFVNENGALVLREDGDISLTVDTGFSGGIALPERILEEMDVESLAGSCLLLDFEKEKVKLME